MLSALKQVIRTSLPNLFLQPQGENGVRKAGHRQYIGGAWDEIGKLQFDFLVSRGLQPQHRLLDIACGSFRLGVKAIPYLDAGHYLGIEKEQSLIDLGKEHELGAGLLAEKRPELVCSASFEFERFSQQPDFAIAQSLFTHLPGDLVNMCFARLRPVLKPDSRFYATYFLRRPGFRNPEKAHDHGFFAFDQPEMEAFGTRNGFVANYIGDWNHPRKQMIVEYRLA